VPAGHQLEDDARFPVFADAENDAFISPLHPSRLPSARVFPESPVRTRNSFVITGLVPVIPIEKSASLRTIGMAGTGP
jgi:hypothetical protein